MSKYHNKYKLIELLLDSPEIYYIKEHIDALTNRNFTDKLDIIYDSDNIIPSIYELNYDDLMDLKYVFANEYDKELTNHRINIVKTDKWYVYNVNPFSCELYVYRGSRHKPLIKYIELLNNTQQSSDYKPTYCSDCHDIIESYSEHRRTLSNKEYITILSDKLPSNIHDGCIVIADNYDDQIFYYDKFNKN